MGRAFRVRMVNRSAYPAEIVWENAQDLEHVAVLHRRTNRWFELLEAAPATGADRLYDALRFRVGRRLLGLVPVTSRGGRRIVGPRTIEQEEESPALGVRTRLLSSLEADPERPGGTLLVDEVEVSVPFWLAPLAPVLAAALRRHARIQCEEDEPYRARRMELRRRGIDLPLSFFRPPEAR